MKCFFEHGPRYLRNFCLSCKSIVYLVLRNKTHPSVVISSSPSRAIDFLKCAKYVSKYDYNLITKCPRVINLAGPNFAGSKADLVFFMGAQVVLYAYVLLLGLFNLTNTQENVNQGSLTEGKG